MAKLIQLDEAAEMLGVSPDKLMEMRSRGEIFGYRDGSNWKFKEQEIERVAGQLGVDAIREEVSGVNLATPTVEGDGADIDSELDQLVDIDLDDSEDTDGPDSVLVSERELGESERSASSTIIGKDLLGGLDADLELVSEEGGESSEELILDLDDDNAKIAEASGIRLDDESGLLLDSEDDVALGGGSELSLEEGSSKLEFGAGSDLGQAGSELDLSASSSDLDLSGEPSDDSPTAGGELKMAEPSDAGSGELNLDMSSSGSELDLSGSSSSSQLSLDASSSDISLSADSEKMDLAASDDDMVIDVDALDGDGVLEIDSSGLSLESASDIDLGGSDDSIDLDASATDIKVGGVDSDVTLGGDSGINLTQLGDSGISLEGTPPELATGSDVEALELGPAEVIDLDEAAIDLGDAAITPDDDFLLTPVESQDQMDDDSGSQVIALDSDEISADEATMLEGFDAIEDVDEVAVVEEEGVETVAPLGLTGAVGVPAATEADYSIWHVVALGLCVTILAMGGMMITDLVRNMWSWNGTYALNSSLMEAIIGMLGM